MHITGAEAVMKGIYMLLIFANKVEGWGGGGWGRGVRSGISVGSRVMTWVP